MTETAKRRWARTSGWLLAWAMLAAAGRSQDGRAVPELERGPHAVGLRVLDLHDRSRAGPGDRSDLPDRALRVALWYPAEVAPDDARLTLSELVGLATESEAGAAFEQYVQGAEEPVRAELSKQGAAPLAVVRDAVAEPGRHPLVLYAASFRASGFENADLCEYLASQGWVVAGVPSLGPLGAPMTTDLIGIEAQTRDLEFVLERLRDEPSVDATRVGVVGYSWGGLTEVVFALRQPRVVALVAFDGSLGYSIGLDPARKYEDFVPERLRADLLHLAQGLGFLRFGRQVDRSWFEGATSVDRTFVQFHALAHGHFSADTLRRSIAPGDASLAAKGIRASYAAACRAAQHFLAPRLEGRPPATPLTAEVLGLDEVLYTQESRPAMPTPTGLDELVSRERAFAADASVRGMDVAFLEVLAPEGLVFRPGPVNGRSWIRAHPSPGAVLEWAPRTARLAAAGDLGFTLGPWLTRAEKGGAVEGRGHFFSIWERVEGTLRLRFDLGVSHEGSFESVAEAFEFLPPQVADSPSSPAPDLLRAAETELREILREESSERAIAEWCGDETWVLRPGVEPLRGAPTGDDSSFEALRDTLFQVSASGDLAWTYGEIEREEPATLQPYARVWRLDENGEARIAVDLRGAPYRKGR